MSAGFSIIIKQTFGVFESGELVVRGSVPFVDAPQMAIL